MGIQKFKQAPFHNLGFIALISFILLLGAVLRFYDLGAESYAVHEVDSALMGQWDIGRILLNRYGQPQLFLLLSHFWMAVFGTSEIATRSLSALAGTACLPLMYGVGRDLFGRNVGLISSLLMAISEFQIFYSQEFRYYPLFALMTLFSFFFYIRALRSGKRGYFALYVLASILLLYTHTLAVCVLVAQDLYFVLRWNRYKRLIALWFLCQILILLAFTPGLALAYLAKTGAGAHVLDWISIPALWQPFLTIAKYVFPLTAIRYHHYSIGGAILAGMAFLGTGTALFIVWKGKERWLASARRLVQVKGPLTNKDNLLLVGCWFLCPIILPFLASYFLFPMYTQQYTISAAPAMYLLVALGIVAIHEVVPEPILLGAFAILIASGLYDYYSVASKEQWRQTTAYVTENSQKEDIIVFAPAYASEGFNWYYRGDLRECLMPPNLTDDKAFGDALTGCTNNVKRFWVIIRESEEMDALFRAFYDKLNPQQIRLERDQAYVGISVYLFSVPEH